MWCNWIVDPDMKIKNTASILWNKAPMFAIKMTSFIHYVRPRMTAVVCRKFAVMIKPENCAKVVEAGLSASSDISTRLSPYLWAHGLIPYEAVVRGSRQAGSDISTDNSSKRHPREKETWRQTCHWLALLYKHNKPTSVINWQWRWLLYIPLMQLIR